MSVIGLLGGLALAAASGALSASGSAGASTQTTLRFIQIQTSEHFINIAPKGSVAGDMDVITVNLLSGRRVVGHGRIVGVAVDFPNVQVSRTDVLPGGHLTTVDTYNDTVNRQELAIVGGTGVYRGATLTLTQLGGNRIGVVFTIST